MQRGTPNGRLRRHRPKLLNNESDNIIIIISSEYCSNEKLWEEWDADVLRLAAPFCLSETEFKQLVLPAQSQFSRMLESLAWATSPSLNFQVSESTSYGFSCLSSVAQNGNPFEAA